MPSEHPRSEGERRKLSSHLTFEARRSAILTEARRALLRRLLNGQASITADHIRDDIDLPADIDGRCLGPAASGLARLGILRHSGFVKSSRAAANSRLLYVWELIDRKAAETWLRRHPEALESERGENLERCTPAGEEDHGQAEPPRDKADQRDPSKSAGGDQMGLFGDEGGIF